MIRKEGIPKKQSVIVAPNHQNALMDAMTFVCNTPFQHVFLARADIFRGKRLVRFLTYLNIMPIFRIRDGIENVKKNDEVFEKTTRVLHNRNNPIILFAEGSHGDRRRLRPLVKGLFRIAFQAQEKYGTEPAVKIIPIGVDYGHYQNFRSTLLVNVGEPIEVSGFYREYNENPAGAINHIKEIFAAALGKLMIDIQTEEFYVLYMRLREMFNDNMRSYLGIRDKSLFGKFKADKAMIELLDKELESDPSNIKNLHDLVQKYYECLKKTRLRDWVVKNHPFGFSDIVLPVVAKILLFPVFAFGFLNNIIPYILTASRVANIKDQQFHSSFKYVVGMLVFPVWYLALAGILAFLSVNLRSIVLYLLLLPLTGLLAFDYYIKFRKLLGKLRFITGKNSSAVRSLIEKRSRIIALTTNIIERQNRFNEYPR